MKQKKGGSKTMTKKLSKIKKEAHAICSDVSTDLRAAAKQLDKVSTALFKSLNDFDRWFNSDQPLTL